MAQRRVGRDPLAKQAGVKRVAKELVERVATGQGKERVVGLFAVMVLAGGQGEMVYAMTVEEAAVLAQMGVAALERALATVYAAATRSDGKSKH
jgi:hypothetical protein